MKSATGSSKDLRHQGVNERPAMRIQHFADVMGVSIHCARSWAYARKIASVKVGKLLFIPSTEVTRLLTENLTPAVSD